MNSVGRSTVISEIKASANRNRIMSDKLGVVTFKISDEIWEKYFPYFQASSILFFETCWLDFRHWIIIVKMVFEILVFELHF